jgi:hypothetical protein
VRTGEVCGIEIAEAGIRGWARAPGGGRARRSHEQGSAAFGWPGRQAATPRVVRGSPGPSLAIVAARTRDDALDGREEPVALMLQKLGLAGARPPRPR